MIVERASHVVIFRIFHVRWVARVEQKLVLPQVRTDEQHHVVSEFAVLLSSYSRSYPVTKRVLLHFDLAQHLFIFRLRLIQ